MTEHACTGDNPYPVPLDQRFYLRDLGQLQAELERLDVALPLEADGHSLEHPLACPSPGAGLVNRWMARLEAGHDAARDGTPSALTIGRYGRYAAGGYGLLCSEPVMVPPAELAGPHLCLTPDTLPAFAALTAQTRAAAPASGCPLLVLQLDATGVASADAAGRLDETCAATAQLALEAGFDGVALGCVSGAPAAELEAAVARATGDARAFEPSALIISRAVEAVTSACPEAFVLVRLCVFDPRREPLGFGAAVADARRFDAALPTALAMHLASVGADLLELTTRHPAWRASPGSAADVPVAPDGFPHEHPLSAFARRARIVQTLRSSLPSLPVAIAADDWLRQFLPAVAAGLIRDGWADAVALNRFALAYPEAPVDWARERELDPYRCCIQCGACDRLRAAGMPAGCVVHAGETYGPGLRQLRRFAPDRLQTEARRCLQCVPAPCTRAIPGAPDIPAIMRAVARGDRAHAGRLLRQRLVLPEMSLALAPYSVSGEGACVLGALVDQPIRIRDVLLDAALASAGESPSTARTSDPGVRRGAAASERGITIAGAGPAGLAAAAVLLDHGYRVTVIERADRPGGVPELLIPATRYGGAQAEVEALFTAARANGRLVERYNTIAGRDVSWSAMHQDGDALLLATGLWADTRLIAGGDGLYGGLDFLEQAKAGRLTVPRGAAAVLAGGDCAMDAATVLEANGVAPLFIVFEGERAGMHWCMDEAWFNRPGIHLLTLCRPVAVRRDAAGWVTGLRTVRMTPGQDGGVEPLPGSEATLDVTCVVDASGLAPDDDGASSVDAANGIFAVGACVNGGASVAQCVAEGMQAAARIHRYLAGDA